MKKIISSLLVMVVLFNFILSSGSYATSTTTDADEPAIFQGTNSITPDSITVTDEMDIVENGTADGKTLDWGLLGSVFGTVAGILAVAANFFPMLLQAGMGLVTEMDLFTIEDAVFNQIPLFNIDFFNFGRSYKIGIAPDTKSIRAKKKTWQIIKPLRENVAKYFYIFRLISIILSLLVLIYAGIRMAISTIASEKTKYKQMLIAWFESVILLYLMQFIIAGTIFVGGKFGDIVYYLRRAVEKNGNLGFENTIIENLTSRFVGNAGWLYAINCIAYWCLVFIQTKFFILYFKRVITVGFLILISPFISVVYPLDKIGDGKSQSFTVWFHELALNILIQPIHAMIYLIFMFTAGEIARYSNFVAILLLFSLTKVEKIILQLFNLRNVVSLRPVDDQRKKRK